MKTKNRKKVLNNVFDYDLFRDVMKDDSFFERFDVDMDVVAKVAARDAMTYNKSSDMSMTEAERIRLVRGEF